MCKPSSSPCKPTDDDRLLTLQDPAFRELLKKPKFCSWMRTQILQRGETPRNRSAYLRTAEPAFLANLPEEVSLYLIGIAVKLFKAAREKAIEKAREKGRKAANGAAFTYTYRVKFKPIVALLGAEVDKHQLPCDRETADTVLDEAWAESEPEPADFVKFWNLYPRGEQRKRAALEWAQLDQPDRDAALAGLPEWLEWTQNHSFLGQELPHACNYLNNRRWEDEFPEEDEDTETTRS